MRQSFERCLGHVFDWNGKGNVLWRGLIQHNLCGMPSWALLRCSFSFNTLISSIYNKLGMCLPETACTPSR